MVNTNPRTLTETQIADYHDCGYLILRGVLSSGEADALRRLVVEETPRLGYPPKLKYPEPGKYTIGGNSMAEPGFAPIAEHPTVVNAVECLLGHSAYLTAYVAYLRSPGDKGSGAHCDYKRWRPVGSSMNWLFAIIPLTDFNDEYGTLLLSPGSHKLSSVIDPSAAIWDVLRPDAKQLPEFIDPELKAGDLVLMHGHTWHKAPAGTSSNDRCGIFNKYCAVNAPPAAGYYSYDHAAYESLSDQGKRLIPVHFDKPIATTRLLIEDGSNKDSRYLVVRDEGGNGWQLPGGEGGEEVKVGWDVGARVGSLQSLIGSQLGVDLPWMSYIEDVEESGGPCRLYGYTDAGFDPDSVKGEGRAWFTKDELLSTLGESDPINHAVTTWKREDIIRGKGKAIHQSKQQFE